MTFLNDLNLLSVVATVITLAICGCVLFLDTRDWLNRRKSNGEFDGEKQCVYLCMISLACLVGVIDAFSPSAHVPHKTVTGEYRVVAHTSGKGGSTDFICVIDCTRTGGYTLALNDDAQSALWKRHAGGRYEFEYLTYPSGNAFAGVWLRVVGIRDAESGAQLYEVDLARHWGRVLLFTVDFLLLVGTGVLCVRLERGEKKGKREDDEDDPEPLQAGHMIT
jgi:hypothetical protein